MDRGLPRTEPGQHRQMITKVLDQDNMDRRLPRYWTRTTSTDDYQATLTTVNNIPVNFTNNHNHPGDTIGLAAFVFLNNVKKRCREQTEPMPSVFDEELGNLYDKDFDADVEDMIQKIPTFNSCKSSLYRSRSKVMPKLPATQGDIDLQGRWKETSSGSRFLLCDDTNAIGERIIVFGTDNNLQRLAESSTTFVFRLKDVTKQNMLAKIAASSKVENSTKSGVGCSEDDDGGGVDLHIDDGKCTGIDNILPVSHDVKMAANMKLFVYLGLCTVNLFFLVSADVPIVVNTWPFTNATIGAWTRLYTQKGSSVDAVVAGCQVCQTQRCDGTVGYGGDPDEEGEVTLDAMIMNGKTMDVGAVGCIRRVKDAIGVARAVMDHTGHTLLVGELATKFAVEMGFKEENLSTPRSDKIYQDWKNNHCQPNFRKNVTPDPTQNCGPYRPLRQDISNIKRDNSRKRYNVERRNHDTIGMVAIDADGHVAAGTSTNGLNHKIPGRVGDSPIMGAGAYARNGVGGAASTGDGDVMMRFLPAFNAVNLMSMGVDPNTAAEKVLIPIKEFYPTFRGAVITVNSDGIVGAACHGFAVFQFSVADVASQGVHIHYKNCSN
ncbi:N(4)-(Beta-N-acetylglucosaminyl)-L-asparaginase-like [Ylistrum balloti]|uniref:N(4)-(Beta-N-acetylglucosaminyl)-L-asparaginase- like n=1 Tax=Ylistrum balloti TaxID=509963 RepID=UPI002905CA38|nr:N(4)-(Beta-N-acetylglucosaminyl)-L-asparaginase-like [Ylistrum balloti]